MIIEIYTMNFCPFCIKAKNILKNKNLPFKEILVADDDEKTWTMLEEKTSFKTMPQIFIDEKFIGGCRELEELIKKGTL